MEYTVTPNGELKVYWLCVTCGRKKNFKPEYVPYWKIKESQDKNHDKYMEPWE